MEARLRQEQEQWQAQRDAEQRQQTRQEDYQGEGLTSKKQALQQTFDAWANEEELPDAAVNLLFSNLPSQAPDPARLVEQIEYQFEVKKADKLYKTEFSDIASDPLLDDLTGRFLSDIIANETVSLEDGIRQAVDKTRTWLAEKAGVPQGQTSPTSDAATKRAQAQANLKNTPNASPSARQPLNSPKPQSIEEARRNAIREMVEANQ